MSQGAVAGSAIDIIASRFGRRARAEDQEPRGAAVETAPPQFIAAEFDRGAQGPPMLVIVVLNRACASYVKQNFKNDAIWTAEELIWFTERFYERNIAENTENGQKSEKWTLRAEIASTIDEKALRGHFLAVCEAKSQFRGFLSKRRP